VLCFSRFFWLGAVLFAKFGYSKSSYVVMGFRRGLFVYFGLQICRSAMANNDEQSTLAMTEDTHTSERLMGALLKFRGFGHSL